MSKQIPAFLAGRPEDYERLKLTKEIQPWEDGVRTTGVKGEYEWWYFDAKLSDGSSLVIVFYTAPMTAMKAGFEPSLSFTLTKLDGTRIDDSGDWDGEYSFASDRCCVKMGPNTFEGDLHTYHIHYERNGILADVELTGNIPSWRPQTGHIYFGDEKFFAWLPSVPEGNVAADVTYEGETTHYTGSGYHDHNWGNTGMFWLMHHWYWGRAKIGEYQAITSYITGQKKYGYEHFMIFLLAKNGEIIGDRGEYARFTQTNEQFNEKTGKHYHEKLEYDYDDGENHYRVSYTEQEVVEQFRMMSSQNNSAAKAGTLMQTAMKFIGLDPSYIRMTGTAKVEKIVDGEVVETTESPALWEMMYFGKDADV